jgi:hypothetical protein
MLFARIRKTALFFLHSLLICAVVACASNPAFAQTTEPVREQSLGKSGFRCTRSPRPGLGRSTGIVPSSRSLRSGAPRTMLKGRGSRSSGDMDQSASHSIQGGIFGWSPSGE